MLRFRHRFMIMLLALCPLILKAQNNELQIGLRAGHYAVFGNFTAVSLGTTQALFDDFSISGGIQYNTIGKTALEARPAYSIDFDWGCLSTEVLMVYTNLTSINNFAAECNIKDLVSSFFLFKGLAIIISS